MNIKVIVIIAVVAGGLYYAFKPLGNMDVLMMSMEVMPEAGIRRIAVSPGSAFDADELAEPGSLTIVEFYTDSCPGCRSLHKHYQRFLEKRGQTRINL